MTEIDQGGDETSEAAPSKRRGALAFFFALATICFMAWFFARRPNVEPTVDAGESALDWSFRSAKGEHSFSDLWKKGPLVVIWLRHYG